MQIYEKIHALVAFRNSGGASSRIASGTEQARKNCWRYMKAGPPQALKCAENCC
jgi:hypothetical protein